MKTKNLKLMEHIKKLFFIVLATVAFTLLMSVSRVRADVYYQWDEETSTLTISGDGTVTQSDWIDISGIDGNKGKVTKVEIGEGITGIDDNAFESCFNLTEVTFAPESSLQTIGSYAFQGTRVSSIEIPSKVTSIGGNAFKGCSNLTEITFAPESSLQTIGGYAFQFTQVSSIEIPSKVTSIGGNAFKDCGSLTSITIPKSVESIGGSVFNGCGSLESIYVDAKSTHYMVEDGVFYTKDKTTLVRYIPNQSSDSFVIPSSVTSITAGAFDSCKYLKTISFEDGTSIGSIGVNAFSSCDSLTSIAIPASVTSIGDSAFWGCINLNTITFEKTEGSPPALSKIKGRAFGSCTSLTSITIPAQVTSIDDDAFWGCSSLATALVPDGCEIADSAFPNTTKVYRYVADAQGDITAVLVPYDLDPIPDIIPPKAAIIRDKDDDGNITIRKSDNANLSKLPGFNFQWDKHFVCWSDGTTSYVAGAAVPDIGDWVLTAQTGYTVDITPGEGVEHLTLISDPDGTEDTGGYVIGSKEAVLENTQLRVYAKAKEGYRNPQITVKQGNDPVQVTDNCFVVTGDTNVTATATAIECDLSITASGTGAGYTIKVNGNEFTGSSVPYNSKVELKADDVDGFIGWFLPNGTMVSSDKNYTFVMHGKAEYEVRYQSSAKKVTFQANGAVIKVVQTEDEINDLPIHPELQGMTFTGWQVEGTSGTYEDALQVINNALKRLNTLTVTAIYAAISAETDTYGEFTVEVKKKSGSGDEESCDELNQSVEMSRCVTFIAPEAKVTEEFSHWELNGVRISTNPTVDFIVVKDCTLTAVYVDKPVAGMPSFELKRARYKEGSLILEAELTEVEVGSLKDVRFVYAIGAVPGDESPSVGCTLDPDGKGTYVATINGVNLGDEYYIQPVMTLNEDIKGQIIQVDPESGYDRDEKASAVITEYGNNETGGVRFVAYLAAPAGASIDEAGVIAATTADGFVATNVLNFETARYVKVSEKAKGTTIPLSYTWTKLKATEAGTVYVRPYVGYTVDKAQRMVLGRRVQWPLKSTE